MYDTEKCSLVFKDNKEREEFIIQCEGIIMKEYGARSITSFEKWRKDGERFLNEEFMNGPSFPFLNDGRLEFVEWLMGTLLTSVLYMIWDDEYRLVDAFRFIESMITAYSSLGEKYSFFVETLRMIYCSLDSEIQCYKDF